MEVVISMKLRFLTYQEVLKISGFCRTSISANTYKGSPPKENFADMITKNNPAFNRL